MDNFGIYLCEFIGTALLILLGDGVVSNVCLEKSGMKGGGSVQITIGWGIAVMIPACIFGAVSGAHFNPALTIALATASRLSWSLVPGYIISQMLGGMLGAFIVYVFFKDQFDATKDPLVKRGCFCTSPQIRNIPRNLFCEIVATFILVFALMGFGNVIGAQAYGVNYLFVYSLIVGIGMSLGGTTGYAINPARDFAPRVIHALVRFKSEKADSDWKYSLVPVLGPIIGGLIAAFLYIHMDWVVNWVI